MRFEGGNLSTLTTATGDAPIVAIRAPATECCRLIELEITLIAATASRFGLARATTVSVTPVSTKVGRNTIPGAPDSNTLLVSGWTTPPVISTNYIERCSLPAVIGAGKIWTWPEHRALYVGVGTAIAELVIANIVAVACSLFEYTAKWED